jgi:hypothetical protein
MNCRKIAILFSVLAVAGCTHKSTATPPRLTDDEQIELFKTAHVLQAQGLAEKDKWEAEKKPLDEMRKKTVELIEAKYPGGYKVTPSGTSYTLTRPGAPTPDLAAPKLSMDDQVTLFKLDLQLKLASDVINKEWADNSAPAATAVNKLVKKYEDEHPGYSVQQDGAGYILVAKPEEKK